MSYANRLRLRVAAAAVASGALAVGGFALATSAHASGGHPAVNSLSNPRNASGDRPTVYNFSTLDNPADLTFNQLLGVNDDGLIAGYFGSGAQGHPNQGYLLQPGGAYQSENFPGSVQTQVTGLNNNGVTVGFWSDMNNANQVNDNSGFYEMNGSFHNPTVRTAPPTRGAVRKPGLVLEWRRDQRSRRSGRPRRPGPAKTLRLRIGPGSRCQPG
jgi:hypothetical protein